MRNRYVAVIAAAALLAGGGGTYALTTHESAPKARMVAASVPLDPSARDLAAYKGDASAKGQARHAAATAARKAVARRARAGYEPSTNPADDGWVPTTPIGQPCSGDPGSYLVTQPDGTCSGPWHKGPRYYDNDGNPCPGDSPCEDNPAYPDDNTSNDPLISKCPSGAATSAECARLIKGGDEPNMQAPHCGDGSTPAYLRAHGVHCGG